MTPLLIAPPISAGTWFNTPGPISLAQLRGKVVVLYAFQMLCPGCVYRATPQISRLHRLTGNDENIAVIGLHTVFEHHDSMGPTALGTYLDEFGVTFPVGVDLHEPGEAAPVTMRRFGLRGTPSVVLIDSHERIRNHFFGEIDDIHLGIRVGHLLAEAAEGPAPVLSDERCGSSGCDETSCER